MTTITITARPRVKFTLVESGIALGAPGLSAYEVWLAEGNVGDESVYLASLQGDTGSQGETGEGVPTGGTTNQVLAKKSNTDFDTEWKDPSAVSETDPVVGAIDGLVKANGAGVISAAVAMTDYVVPFDIYNTSAWVQNHAYAIGDRFSVVEEGGSTAYYIVHTGFTSDATYNLTGKESANCYAYYIAPAAENDPVFSQWLNDTPPAYPGDIPSVAGLLDETAHDQLDHSGLTGIPSIAGLLDETAHDLLDHTGLTGILALGTTAGTALEGDTAIPSIAGLLDETAHDNLDHTGLTGIHASGSDAETAATIATIINGVSADTIADADTVPFYKSVGGLLKKITWSNIKTTIKTYLDGYWGNVTNKSQQVLHGFVNTTDTSLPADIVTSAGTFVFTLTKVNNYTVYIDGVPIVKTASLSIDLMLQSAWGNGTTDPIGQWYVWFKADGTLGASKTAWSILDVTVTPCSIVWVQSTGGSNFEGIVSEERHSAGRNLLEHNNQHNSWGAQYVSGFTGITIGTGVVGNATNTFSLVGGTIRDEELPSIASNPQTACRIGYKDGANAWMKFDASGATYVKLSGAEPVYDASGTLTPIPTTGGGRYGIIWQYMTNRRVVKIVHILGQGFYTSVALAQAAAQPTLYGFTTAEWKLLNRIIIRNVGGALQWIQTDPLYNLSLGVAVGAGAITTISAGNVSLNPYGGVIATNLQAAIEELDTEKLSTRVLAAYVVAGGTALTTGDGKAYIRIPSALNGMNLVSCAIQVIVTSSSGLPTVQLARGRQASATSDFTYVDILSTSLTIDATEYDSKDATTAAVINTSNDDMVTGDVIRVDCDVAGTGTKGLNLTLTFSL